MSSTAEHQNKQFNCVFNQTQNRIMSSRNNSTLSRPNSVANSPYIGGKPNLGFHNPTFESSQIFYPAQGIRRPIFSPSQAVNCLIQRQRTEGCQNILPDINNLAQMSQTLCGFKQFQLPQIEENKKANNNNNNNCNTAISTLTQLCTTSSPQVKLHQFTKGSQQQQENNTELILETPKKICSRMAMTVKEPFQRGATCDSKMKFQRKQAVDEVLNGDQPNTVKLLKNKCNTQGDNLQDFRVTGKVEKYLLPQGNKAECDGNVGNAEDYGVCDIDKRNQNICEQNSNFWQNDHKQTIHLKKCQDNSNEFCSKQPILIRQSGIKQTSEGDSEIKSQQKQCKEADVHETQLNKDGCNSDKELLCIQCVNEDLIVEKQKREQLEKKKDCLWMNKMMEVEKCRLGELNHEALIKKDKMAQLNEDIRLMLQQKEDSKKRLQKQNEEYHNFLAEQDCQQEERDRMKKQEKYQNNRCLREFMQNQIVDKQHKNLCSKQEDNRKDMAVMDYNKKEMESQVIEQAVRMKRMHLFRQSLIKQALQKKITEDQAKSIEQRKDKCINEAANQLLDQVNRGTGGNLRKKQ